MRFTSTITFSMVAISGREEEESAVLRRRGRKVLEGSGRIEGESASPLPACVRAEQMPDRGVAPAATRNCLPFFYFSSGFAPPFSKSSSGNCFLVHPNYWRVFQYSFKKDFKCPEFLHMPERRVLAFNQTGPYSLGSSYIRVQFIWWNFNFFFGPSWRKVSMYSVQANDLFFFPRPSATLANSRLLR